MNIQGIAGITLLVGAAVLLYLNCKATADGIDDPVHKTVTGRLPGNTLVH